MPKGLKGAVAVLASCLLLGAVAAPGASASHNQLVFFEAPAQLLNPKLRASAVSTLQHLGVKAVRIELHWREVAPSPNSSKKPSFDATNPASYNWTVYDPLIEEAEKLKWKILLTVTSPVPRWATASHKDFITRPDDRDFEEFMTAVGKRYGTGIAYWAIWNEPNIPGWLSPQFAANGTPESPRLYRGLYQAGYAGLEKAELETAPKVLFGETAPFGVDHVNVKHEGPNHEVAPLLFLRQALCLSSSYKKSSSCSELKMSGYGHHPYTYPAVQGPFYRPPNKDEVPIGALARLQSALDKAANAHAIPRGTKMFLDEYGVQTKPNPLGVSPAEQAEYAAISERIAWEDPAVAAFSQYLLRDEGKHGRFVGYRTGLEGPTGTRKPSYYAFALPLTVTKVGHSYSLWGLVRPTLAATKVTVMVRSSASSHFRKLTTVSTDLNGYWHLRSTTKAQAWEVKWTSPGGSNFQSPPIRAFP
jgi:hypothetical protein